MIPILDGPSESAVPVSVAAHRWYPSRAGLLNVWQYTDEVLEFEQGRLVLYGPNGSGKTMALELLLPHLLDAKGMPGRLSTSGADRGGLWERVSGYDEGEPRTGYLWLEFAQDDGTSFTAGVRLRAKPSGGGEKHWFTTSRRVGVDFSLLDEHRRPLSVEQLAEALAGTGKVWGADTGGYRHTVRTTLFPGWSEDRLDALIRTLLVVRKQNVTEGLSPATLSTLLSEALPPLDELELGRVADGFADLDRRRDHIAQIESDIAATRRLAEANRAYARAVVARVVGEVVAATTALDNVTRDVRRLAAQLEECKTRVTDLEAREQALEVEDQSLTGRLDGLKSSEAYKHGAALEDLQQAADGARRRAEESERDASTGRERAQHARQRATEASDHHERVTSQLRRARQELETAAAALGAGMLAEITDQALPGVAGVWIEGREQGIREVRAELRALELATERRKSAQQHQAACEAHLSRLEEEAHAAAQAAEEARRTWESAVSSWRAEARELSPYLAALDEPDTAAERVAEARSRAQEPLIDRRSQVQQRLAVVEAELEELRNEREAWVAGKEPEPESPPGRRERIGLAGAPLWRLVQFREGIEEGIRGNVESALAEAHLLDAWVSADGRVSIADGESDLLLLETPASTAPGLEHTLGALLEPDLATDALSRETVERILSSLALIERDAHVAPTPDQGVLIGRDGSWRTTRLAGRAALGPARYIGASSREATRRARIASLDRDIAEREVERDSLQAERQVLEARLERCDHELRAFPPTAPIREAEQALDRSRVRVESARGALVQANTRLFEANEEVKRHQLQLQRVASGHDLPAESARLDDVGRRLAGIRSGVVAFERHLDRVEASKRDADRAADAAADLETEASRRTETARARRGEQQETAAKFAAVEAAVGADYREVLDEIRKATGRRAEIQAEQRSVRAQRNEAAEEKGRAAVALMEAERRRADAEAQRTRVGEAFVSLCSDGIVADAQIENPPGSESLGSTTAILDAARRVRSSGVLPGLPEDADLTRMSNTVVGRVGDASRQLAGRADLSFETSERGWSVLRARREGIVLSALGLLEGLRDDLNAASAELTQKQQELFEEILVRIGARAPQGAPGPHRHWSIESTRFSARSGPRPEGSWCASSGRSTRT